MLAIAGGDQSGAIMSMKSYREQKREAKSLLKSMRFMDFEAQKVRLLLSLLLVLNFLSRKYVVTCCRRVERVGPTDKMSPYGPTPSDLLLRMGTVLQVRPLSSSSFIPFTVEETFYTLDAVLEFISVGVEPL